MPNRTKTQNFILVFCLYSIFCLIFCIEAQGAGTSGNAFLKIGIGAKPAGMGEVSVAVTDDVSSIYWNPAGLAQVKNTQLSAMHIEWFDDIRYEWIGFAQPLTTRFAVAADVSYLYMGSIPRTIESVSEGYEADGTFSPVDMAVRVAFAAKLFKHFLAGGSFQRVQSRINFNDVTKQKIEDKTSQSMAIDIGGIYHVPIITGLSVGGCFQNFGRQNKAFIEKNESMPFAFNVGVSYKTLVSTGKTQDKKQENKTTGTDTSKPDAKPQPQNFGALTVAMDINFPTDSPVGTHIGIEYRFGNGIAIRGGYRTGTGFDFPSGLSGGFGYGTGDYQLDYAFVPYGNLGNTHRVSFTIRF
jgi:hypothetical protein